MLTEGRDSAITERSWGGRGAEARCRNWELAQWKGQLSQVSGRDQGRCRGEWAQKKRQEPKSSSKTTNPHQTMETEASLFGECSETI